MTVPDYVCAPKELADPIILPEGWVMLHRNWDGMGGVGIKYLGGLDPLGRIEELEELLRRGRQILSNEAIVKVQGDLVGQVVFGSWAKDVDRILDGMPLVRPKGG